MNKVKLFLDDERECPEGYIACRWPKDVIFYIATLGKGVEEISLDHDLGDAQNAEKEERREVTGYDVLLFLEESVCEDPTFHIPRLKIHSANSSAREKMLNAINSIERRKAP